MSRTAFALGYAEHGECPLSGRVVAISRVLDECLGLEPLLILEAGRREGKRASREARHSRLYTFHSKELASTLSPVLQRLPDELASQLADSASAHAQAGQTPVLRRRAVAGIAFASIATTLTAEERQALDEENAAGWAHATAHGMGEAEATPKSGGPPDPAKVAAAGAAALLLIAPSQASSAAVGWTDLELHTLAMGAALAAGDGHDLGESTRAVASALVDSGAATTEYANQLHAAVTTAYIQSTQENYPGRLYNWVVSADPCANCTDNQLASPYTWDTVPGCPEHPHCQCNVEMAGESALVSV
jgi:hypothetical protein